ncbi:MAG: hypothetical protein IJW99_06500 [Clostridia bacterium]|nr:hypothetical protein [Clostridia bacterium]
MKQQREMNSYGRTSDTVDRFERDLTSRWADTHALFLALLYLVLSILLAFGLGRVMYNATVEWLHPLLPALSDTLTRALYYFITVSSAIFFYLLCPEDHGLAELCLNALTPLSLILGAGLIKTEPLMGTLLALAALFGCILAEMIASRHARSCGDRRLLRHRMFLPRYILCAFFLACLLLVMFCDVQPTASEETVSFAYHEEIDDTLEERYRLACVELEWESFNALTVEEKLDVLQRICDYECLVTLGIPSVDLHVMEIENNSSGNYSYQSDNDICINIDTAIIEHRKVDTVLHVLFHEIRHHWQRWMINMYSSVYEHIGDEYRNMNLWQEVEQFQWENEHYVSWTEDMQTYNGQRIEQDSDEWAQERVPAYLPYIYPEDIPEE